MGHLVTPDRNNGRPYPGSTTFDLSATLQPALECPQALLNHDRPYHAFPALYPTDKNYGSGSGIRGSGEQYLAALFSIPGAGTDFLRSILLE